MKKTCRILLSASLLGVLGMVSVPSQALVKWNFVSANCVGGQCSNSSRKFDAFLANAGESPGTVTATGWANTEPSTTNNVLAIGEVHDFGTSGIGVVNADAGATGNPESTGSGEHGVDNIGRYDLVLFQFQDSVSISEVGIGWFEEDADISLLAWVGGDIGDSPDINGVAYSGSSEGLTGKGWELIGNWDVDTRDPDVDQGSETNSLDYVQAVSTNVSSSYWIVAAYNPIFAAGPNPENHDFHTLDDRMKILSLAGTIDTPTTTTNVPAPASLLLLLGGIVPVLRRRRRIG